MKAVELKQVSFSYDGEKKVLDNVDFFAEYGEITLISGASGQGKSTLSSIICGIIPNVNEGVLNGSVLVDGEEMQGKRLGTICRKVGIVLQNADEQIVHKIVEDEIAFGCENLAFAPDDISHKINEVCKLMNIDPKWKTRSLSGGQKQRLITASTLAMGQKIVILDEPLANLDKEGSELLMSILRSLCEKGYCIIISEHRLDMIMPYADKVWHMEKGKIKQIEDAFSYLSGQSKQIDDVCPRFISKDYAFRLENVGFSVKDRKILDDVTVAIPKSGRVVLLGENGCGKTTLLRLISRLYKPTKGRITQNIDERFGQKNKCSRKWFKSVGIVYQNPDYQLFMPTVRAEIEFGAQSKEYAQCVMERFSLAHLADRHPHSLSEGQKRRVSIAAVLASRPQILILDEPTVGQDYEGLKSLVDILNSEHIDSGNTMITVTHDVRCAKALCDIAVVIKDGKVASIGGKDKVDEFFSLSKD
ncbi:MAG: energy-coupling factor ABC transporter ATP-binding protein [Clostridia bacterium]|nr:energy-coupling factor ABC transporter ATP-binding protein [Clostridia bacterium]